MFGHLRQSKNLLHDPYGCQWLRFRRYHDGQLLAFLPTGKIVFPDGCSEIFPTEPGHYFAASLTHATNVAFAYIIHAHRTLTFRRDQAFGPTKEGVSYLLSYRRRRRRRLPFVCDPNRERLELFDYDTFRTEHAEGRWEYYSFRHGLWRLLNYRGPFLMTDQDFEDARKRVLYFERGHYYGYGPSPHTVWSDARSAEVVTAEECDEAARRYGPMWHYSGD
jgi:hypothetical protein